MPFWGRNQFAEFLNHLFSTCLTFLWWLNRHLCNIVYNSHQLGPEQGCSFVFYRSWIQWYGRLWSQRSLRCAIPWWPHLGFSFWFCEIALIRKCIHIHELKPFQQEQFHQERVLNMCMRCYLTHLLISRAYINEPLKALSKILQSSYLNCRIQIQYFHFLNWLHNCTSPNQCNPGWREFHEETYCVHCKVSASLDPTWSCLKSRNHLGNDCFLH